MVNQLLVEIGVKHINLYQISFSFLSPYKVIGSIKANSEEEAKTLLIESIEENNPEIGEITIEDVELITESSLYLEEPMGHA